MKSRLIAVLVAGTVLLLFACAKRTISPLSATEAEAVFAFAGPAIVLERGPKPQTGTVEVSPSSRTGAETTITVLFTAKDSAAAVLGRIQAALMEEGWTVALLGNSLIILRGPQREPVISVGLGVEYAESTPDRSVNDFWTLR